jgi:hypothetical protein
MTQKPIEAMTLGQLERHLRKMSRAAMLEAARAAIVGRDPKSFYTEERARNAAQLASRQARELSSRLQKVLDKVAGEYTVIALRAIREAKEREEADRRAAHTGLVAT